MSKLKKCTARVAAVVLAAGTSVAMMGGSASAAAGCTPDPIADPNLGVYACYDYDTLDSDPSNPGAELTTAAFVDVDVFGQVRVCVGRVNVGAQLVPDAPLTSDYTAETDGLGARLC